MTIKVTAPTPVLPENAHELTLDAPTDNLQALRLSVAGGPVTLYSGVETILVPDEGQVELRTSSPTIHYVADNVHDVRIKTLGWEQSSLPDYHDRYMRAR
jgi:hypothetical protein